MLLVFLLFAISWTVGHAIPTYVMLNLDFITNENILANPNKLSSNLATLAGAGVEGVMADVWWGLTEPNSQAYNFSAYVELANIVASARLKLQVVMSAHSCGGNVGDACNIPIPSWVRQTNPFYVDREGGKDSEYVSLFFDSVTLSDGRTPVQAYEDWYKAFVNAMGSHMGSTIKQVEIGMGPAGELRFPSYQLSKWSFCGIGEFQCYDVQALASLAAAANASGHPEWGHGGPDDAGTYNSKPPSSVSFFTSSSQDNYESDYGQFFLGWYSSSLLGHADRVLGAAQKAFPPSVKLFGKVAGIHWWYKDPSHAAELTAGYWVTKGGDGKGDYEAIANLFASKNAGLCFTALEMQDDEQPASCDCGPYELVRQVKQASIDASTPFSGENALPRFDQTAYSTIETQATALGKDIDDFTYLRLGPKLLDQSNFGTFEAFVSKMKSL